MIDDIKFVGYRMFYNNRTFIKERYKLLSKKDKQIYKLYVYSRRYLRERTCDIIWCFLNDDDVDNITESMLKDECYKYRM